MVVPIKSIIRNKRLLSLLESQFSAGTELGVEYVEGDLGRNSIVKYRVYTGKGNDDWSRDRFVIQRFRISGKIRRYCLEGSIYFEQ